MRFTTFGKRTGLDLDAISLEDLMQALSDFLLQSGFGSRRGRRGRRQDDSMDALREALLRLLQREGFLSEDELEALRGDDEEIGEAVWQDLVDRLIEKLIEEGYLSVEQIEGLARRAAEQEAAGKGTRGEAENRPVSFQVTQKGLDLLGYKALRDLMGTIGRSNLGRHDTNQLATGVEASLGSKPYEFGDSLNLDVNATLLSALSREGVGVPIPLDYGDLMVHQSDYTSACATVVMLDCSHSMILYGEDRFTPAKRVALALSHLIRTQYPGDTIRLVLFHDSAEEVPLSKLAGVQVGPYHTNTREGLRLARRILLSQRTDMRQIVMITDGKPSAMTLEDGSVYKNPFGLDPEIIEETMREVARCARAGIQVNTFMLAADYALVNFVKEMTAVCRGKAYFTTTADLGQYILVDFLKRRRRRVGGGG
jgi:Ca-activated chloride channel family protein